MSLVCQCPAATALPTIGSPECPETFGQIQKVAFRRLNATTPFDDGGSSPIATKATWTDFMADGTDDKIVVSPYIYNPTDGGGDARLTSGGNDDLGGLPLVLGGNPVTFEGQFREVPQKTIKIIKELQCEALAGNLGVFLFDENGKVECIADGNYYYPIPIRALFIGSKIHGGWDAKDSNLISWQYAENYSKDLAIITPDFNPLSLS